MGYIILLIALVAILAIVAYAVNSSKKKLKQELLKKTEGAENSDIAAADNEEELKRLEKEEFEKILTQPVFKKSVVSPKSEVTADGFIKRKAFEVKKDLKVLIADDRTDDALALKKVFDLAGAKTEVAENGNKCIEAIRNNEYNMIFIARDMARMDGIQTIRNLKTEELNVNLETPIFAVVSTNSDEPKVFFEKEGFTGIIKKPIGAYIVEKTVIDNVSRDLILSDDDLIREIMELASDEYKLQKCGVILSIGLKNYEGSLSLYTNTADRFCESYKDMSCKVMDALYASDSKTYMELVRNLREASRNLGIIYLADIFDDHVNMAKNDDMEVAEASWRKLVLEWEAVVTGIGKWLGKTYIIPNATEVLEDE